MLLPPVEPNQVVVVVVGVGVEISECQARTNEGGGMITSVVDQLPKPISETRGQFVVTLDGRPLAYAGAHGQSLDWFASP